MHTHKHLHKQILNLKDPTPTPTQLELQCATHNPLNNKKVRKLQYPFFNNQTNISKYSLALIRK
jgi:hypothetical protein